MATIKFLEQRIVGREKEIEKLTKKLGRIEAAQATNWEKNPYYYSESDLRNTKLDLASAQAQLKKYREELELAKQKANSRNVAAILEFLDIWKQNCREYYGKGLSEVYAELAIIRELSAKVNTAERYSDEYNELLRDYESRRKEYSKNIRGEYETVTEKRGGRTITGQKKVADGKWEYVVPYMSGSYEASMAKLSEVLDKEANRKYDFIIERTCAIVGEITDASGLHVGYKQDLNGVIIGTNGKAKVQTIGAGGYNIQCFHFRTLIGPVND